MVTPTGMLWNTESYTAVVEAIEEEVMDAARAVYFEILDLRITVQTKGALEWEVTHGDTLASLNSTQTEVWTNAVVDCVTNWENAREDPALAADIYDAAKRILLHYRLIVPAYRKNIASPQQSLKLSSA